MCSEWRWVLLAEIDGSGIVDAVAEHVCAKPERENFRDYNEYLFLNSTSIPENHQ